MNLASVEGIEGGQSQTAYNASKGGVVLLTRSMAVDYGPDNVRVNCLCPGMIETPMTAPLQDSGAASRCSTGSRSSTCSAARGKPEEVAAAALFLASDDASFVTGHALAVDGGYLAGRRFPGTPVTPTTAIAPASHDPARRRVADRRRRIEPLVRGVGC